MVGLVGVGDIRNTGSGDGNDEQEGELVMGWPFIGFLSFIFVGLTLINRIMEGQWITSAEAGILNNLSVFTSFNVLGIFTIPVPNISFITDGLWHLVSWDYSYFGGNAELLQFFLYSITAALAFLVFIAIIGLAAQALSRARI